MGSMFVASMLPGVGQDATWMDLTNTQPSISERPSGVHQLRLIFYQTKLGPARSSEFSTAPSNKPQHAVRHLEATDRLYCPKNHLFHSSKRLAPKQLRPKAQTVSL